MPPELPIEEPPARPPANRKRACEFCGSQLTVDGEVISLGDAAKGFRDLRATVERLQGELAAAQTETNDIRQKLAEANTKLTASARKRGFFEREDEA